MNLSMKPFRIFFLFSCLTTPQFTQANELKGSFNSSETQTNLIELYSSEGCYSCPPADAWLRKLKTDARLWKQYVPVAFHVNYWDYIGWKDSFASAEFTQRQHNYASNNGSRSVYTPEFFINGREWRGFFKKKMLPTADYKISGLLQVNIENNQAVVTFKPANNTTQSYDINIAILGFDLVNEITDGENEGKTLQHDFVALALKKKPLTRTNSNSFHITTSLPNYLQNHMNTNTQLGLAAWITQHNKPVSVQAVGGWLN